MVTKRSFDPGGVISSFARADLVKLLNGIEPRVLSDPDDKGSAVGIASICHDKEMSLSSIYENR